MIPGSRPFASCISFPRRVFVIGFLLFAWVGQGLAQPGPEPSDGSSSDVLNLASGAVVLSHSSQYNEEWAAMLLLDDTVEHGWSAAEGASFPHEVLIELEEQTTLDSIALDNTTAEEDEYPGISARDFEVWVSTERSDAGFSKALEGEAAQGRRSTFAFPEATSARWMKLVIRSNWGHDAYTELMELEGYGRSEKDRSDRVSISGVYETNYDLMHIEQRGTRIYGCYDFRGGTLVGSIDGAVAQFEWRHEVGGDTGTAIMVLSRSGEALNGLWYQDEEYRGLWIGTRDDEAGPPECTIPTDGGIAQSLSNSGRTIAYGINFDVDSARLRSESEAILGEVLSVLKEQPNLRLIIEGHTDSVGGAAYNMTLSEKRARSVVRWLTEQGVDPERLEAVGYGERRPVSTNEASQGRALNRRVELVRK
ncbi:MAG: OmpA family protein [Bacteroidetes bacterium]|nr:OmpA family protein [Bacteroidota bacterium]